METLPGIIVPVQSWPGSNFNEVDKLPNWSLTSCRLMSYRGHKSVSCEVQTDSSWIWTQVTVSIYYDDNTYTTSAFCKQIQFKEPLQVNADDSEKTR